MAEKMICVKECFVYNKRFKVGAEFPHQWLKEGYLPNAFFMPQSEAEDYIRESKHGNRPIQCAGDDPRSTETLRTALLRFKKSFPENWTRKQIWLELKKYEQAEAQTETENKGK